MKMDSSSITIWPNFYISKGTGMSVRLTFIGRSRWSFHVVFMGIAENLEFKICLLELSRLTINDVRRIVCLSSKILRNKSAKNNLTCMFRLT